MTRRAERTTFGRLWPLRSAPKGRPNSPQANVPQASTWIATTIRARQPTGGRMWPMAKAMG